MSITDFKKEVIKHLAKSKEKTLDVATQTAAATPSRKRPHHELARKIGDSHKVRKLCKGCYKKNKERDGRKYATNKTKKVDTYCKNCAGEPHYCLNCFNEEHVERRDQE